MMNRLDVNQTAFLRCPPSIDRYIHNLTSSYTEKSNEASMVSASVIMFVLAGLFFNLNLFSGISDVSATLDPKFRVFFSKALALFLTVMTYLFSEAKNATSVWTLSSAGTRPAAAELSTGAGLILVWMLLVELLRKKVEVIRMRGYSDTIQRASRVAWLGSLVFFNIKSAGRKAVFSILWVLCATRVVQRIAYTEVGKRSYAHGRNARVISSYMANMDLRERLRADLQGSATQRNATQRFAAQIKRCCWPCATVAERCGAGDDVEKAVGQSKESRAAQELLKMCECDYIVMGEEKMVKEPTGDGYKLKDDKLSSIITVGKVWKELDRPDETNKKDKIFTSTSEAAEEAQRLKELCLSFALFKLLRRKLERRLPAVTADEAQHCRNLALNGLPADNNKMIEVVNGELMFLHEYYHSVVPVVLASPFFFFVNYFLVLAVVAVLCVMAVILCGNGDATYAFKSVVADNYALNSGMFRIAVCLLARAKHSPAAFFSTLDLSITVLLFVIYLYEEIWEFFVFLLSNWFMVSLVCNYVAKPRWRKSPTIRWALRGIIFLRSNLKNRGSLSIRQFSVLSLRWPLWLWLPSYCIPPSLLLLSTEPVPENLNQSIKEYMEKNRLPLINGKSCKFYEQLPPACQIDSVSEIILIWHIATCILEVECSQQQAAADAEAEAAEAAKAAEAAEAAAAEEAKAEAEAAAAKAKTAAEVAAAETEAVRLSKYCAYLVAFQPELLPDNPDKAKRVVKDMKKELGDMFKFKLKHKPGDMLKHKPYFLCSQSKRAEIMKAAEPEPKAGEGEAEADEKKEQSSGRVVRDGAKLARLLCPEASSSNGKVTVWKELADVWTELIVFAAAPSSGDDERVKGHEDVLVQGRGELITVLWALTTHIGVSREPGISKSKVNKVGSKFDS